MCHLADAQPPPPAISSIHENHDDIAYAYLIGRTLILPADDELVSLLVFGGSAVVGKALEVLLGRMGYNARYLPHISLDKPDMLDGVQLLLFVGGVGASLRGKSASLVESIRDKVDAPILELVSSTRGARAGKENLVPWPCRMEELKRRIDAALPDSFFSEGRSESYG